MTTQSCSGKNMSPQTREVHSASKVVCSLIEYCPRTKGRSSLNQVQVDAADTALAEVGRAEHQAWGSYWAVSKVFVGLSQIEGAVSGGLVYQRFREVEPSAHLELHVVCNMPNADV